MLSEFHNSFGSLSYEIRPSVEKAILQLVVDSFELWEKREFPRSGNCEGQFTAPLVGCMVEVKRRQGMSITISDEHRIYTSAMRKGLQDPKHARCIDIAILSWEDDAEESYFCIECKRLGYGSLPRLYVAQGIQRFVGGHYGHSHRSGAMIGYVIKGDPVEVIGVVNSCVEDILDSGHQLIPADSIGWLETVYSSKHDRTSSLSPFSLTHLLFNMNDIESYPLATQLASTETDKGTDASTAALLGD